MWQYPITHAVTINLTFRGKMAKSDSARVLSKEILDGFDKYKVVKSIFL